ncbi:MAG: hypothetical protein EBR82_24255 [Caulobacteraceae bacterium]|nr:hypothetical protein [Caulobacteraceae bacterium]
MADGPQNNNDCKLYMTTDDTSETWTEIKRAKNANLATSSTTASTTSRESDYESEEVVSVKIGPLTFDYVINAGGDSVFTTLRTAHVNKTKIRFAQLDGAINASGSRGWSFWGQVSKADVVEAEGGVRMASVEVVPAKHYYSGNLVEPSEIVVS